MSAVRVSCAVQTHPSRAAAAEALAARLAPLPAEVVTDPDPDHWLPCPWRTYSLALDTTPDWATHRLIVQDDVTLCDGFAEAAPHAIAVHPDAAVVFFHGGTPRVNLHKLDAALSAGEHLAEISPTHLIPVVALSWPKDVICPALCWAYDQGHHPPEFRADDAIVGPMLHEFGVRVYATVPSLVQHEDVVPSTIGKRNWAGEDRNRVAYRFLRTDARHIVW